MMKRILVPQEGSPFSVTATKHACGIAQRTGATVYGKAAIDHSGPLFSGGPSHAEAARHAAATRFAERKLDRHRVQKALELFSRTCAEAGVAHQEARLQGVPVEMLIEQSIFYDLVVTGFSGDYGVDQTHAEKAIGDLLGTSITPFLIVPRDYREIKKVLVCFDGSLPAMRSLQDFAVIAAGADFEVTIVTAEKDVNEAKFLLRRASDYFWSYGVTNCLTEIESAPIREVVFEASSSDRDLDLIVVGAHSRNAVRDFFFGSFTAELLALARTPLFIGQ